jgi:peptidoglycan hydrolase CwlO-like protein
MGNILTTQDLYKKKSWKLLALIITVAFVASFVVGYIVTRYLTDPTPSESYIEANMKRIDEMLESIETHISENVLYIDKIRTTLEENEECIESIERYIKRHQEVLEHAYEQLHKSEIILERLDPTQYDIVVDQFRPSGR